ncbi:MAG TPA: hypothetical protein VFH06_03100 [Candidatus Saccharimonadales bacterium]|nr:hypothetical protein [Candidatus Saccharimonadales bacterium]
MGYGNKPQPTGISQEFPGSSNPCLGQNDLRMLPRFHVGDDDLRLEDDLVVVDTHVRGVELLDEVRRVVRQTDEVLLVNTKKSHLYLFPYNK